MFKIIKFREKVTTIEEMVLFSPGGSVIPGWVDNPYVINVCIKLNLPDLFHGHLPHTLAKENLPIGFLIKKYSGSHCIVIGVIGSVTSV